jgi:hypothetical protein
MEATRQAIKYGYRSGLEESVAKDLETRGIKYEYETKRISYEVAETRTYTPDFILPNGIIVETKGRFVTADRKKHLLIQKQYPQYDIRFVFQNPRAKLYKGSKTTYAQWCDKHGFIWAEKRIPDEWLKLQ